MCNLFRKLSVIHEQWVILLVGKSWFLTFIKIGILKCNLYFFNKIICKVDDYLVVGIAKCNKNIGITHLIASSDIRFI